MVDIELYNKYLSKKVFEIEQPLGDSLPGLPAKVKFRIIGTNDYLSGGNKTEYLTYQITILPSGALNGLVNLFFNNNKAKIITTISSELYYLRFKCNESLKDFLSLFGEDRPVMCIRIDNEQNEEI